MENIPLLDEDTTKVAAVGVNSNQRKTLVNYRNSKQKIKRKNDNMSEVI